MKYTQRSDILLFHRSGHQSRGRIYIEYIHKETGILGAYHNMGVDNFSKGQRAESERRGLGRSLRTITLMEA